MTARRKTWGLLRRLQLPQRIFATGAMAGMLGMATGLTWYELALARTAILLLSFLAIPLSRG